MLQSERITLRPMQEEDWLVLAAWGETREALWGAYQRFQLDHLPVPRDAFEKTGLLRREGGFLVIETIADHEIIGFVRYTLAGMPDDDCPYPEIGFGIGDVRVRGHGFAVEAVRLLVEYLFAGYPCERISSFTDVENTPAQHVLEAAGFCREGVLRRASFRDGCWRDMAVYGIFREEPQTSHAVP
ncbi:MAG TPA: GNAT family protein [Chloroflexota bacterium]|nr:GNAT family protein [Chloroflexota bacterium]